MRFLPAMIVLASAAACAQPQTPGEFKAAVGAGGFRCRADGLTVARPFADVVRDIREPAEKGWNYHTREVNHPGYVEVYEETYRCASKVGSDMADIFVQLEPRPRGVGATMPEGGWFKFVVEVKRLSDRETGVKSFGASIPDAAFDAVRKWAAGEKLDAPPLR